MIPHLAILTLAFMAFSASGSSDPLRLNFFDVPGCGNKSDGTTDTARVLGTYLPDLNVTKMECNSDIIHVDMTNFRNDVESIGFSGDSDSVPKTDYGCHGWSSDRVNATGGILDCTGGAQSGPTPLSSRSVCTAINPDSYFATGPGNCLSINIPKKNGFYMWCGGYPQGSLILPPCPTPIESRIVTPTTTVIKGA